MHIRKTNDDDHEKKDKRFVCDICDQSFSSGQALGVTPRPLGLPVTTYGDGRLASQTNISLSCAF